MMTDEFFSSVHHLNIDSVEGYIAWLRLIDASDKNTAKMKNEKIIFIHAN